MKNRVVSNMLWMIVGRTFYGFRNELFLLFTFLNMLWRFLRKSNLPLRYTPRIFWNNTCCTELWLSLVEDEMNFFFCFLWSGLKLIFHRFAQVFILLKSLFKLVTDKFILSTTEKRETSSAKSLAFVMRPSEKSFM